MPKLKLKHGLTLIELLVVIAIIGILASLATFTFQDSQQKSRDSRRKSDIDAIKKAVELAKQDTAGAYGYPNCNPSGTILANCQISADTTVKLGSTSLATTYIKAVPKDPKTDAGYWYYTYNSDGTTPCTGNQTCPKYRLTVCLENAKDPQKDNPVPAPNPCTSPTVPFSVTNL